MYDELVKELRDSAEWADRLALLMGRAEGDTHAPIMRKAADAIEELSAFREHITDGHFYCMRDGVLYEAKVEPPKGKVFQLPPIEFAEEGET